MTLVEELQREIERWMSSRRNGNLSVLSRLTGVSYPTLRRIMQAEFTPNLETVMQVVSIILDDKQGRVFLCRHFPDFAPIFKKQEEVGYRMLNLAGLLQTLTKEEFMVFNLASGQGVTMARLHQKLGQQADFAIARLTAADLIEVQGEVVKTKIKNVSLTNIEEVLHHMTLAISCFDRERVNDYGSQYGIFSDRLNQEGIEAAHTAMLEAKKKLVEVFTDPKYFGDELYITVLSSSYMD
ncbi:MAG: hypothetical protein V4655_00135 [Bdellovibrionota bacterium]|nr:MAG: hypothetical protein EOP10_20820 [Pseudomonadota bacterium]